MKNTLNTNAFTELNCQEKMNVDGGISPALLGLALGACGDYLIIKSLVYTFKLGYSNGFNSVWYS